MMTSPSKHSSKFSARDHGRLAGTKQRKFTENRSKTGINSQREVE